jgi:hypothetical protein
VMISGQMPPMVEPGASSRLGTQFDDLYWSNLLVWCYITTAGAMQQQRQYGVACWHAVVSCKHVTEKGRAY